jgi:mannose-6-phosphate isomerase class I
MATTLYLTDEQVGSMHDERGTPETPTFADAVRAEDRQVLARIAAAPIIPLNNNLVSRPWGGQRLCAYKGLPSTPRQRWGEAFEICAFAEDEEARAHPSIIRLTDGSEVDLPELLAVAGSTILGGDFVAMHGCQLPLLPKTLDVGELLSVQAHPEGFTEAYIIIEADEGATIRLGFKRDVDPADLGQRLKGGRQVQQRLLDCLRDGVDLEVLQATLASNFARRAVLADAVLPTLESLLQIGADRKIVETLRTLKELYWEVLDLLNEISVTPGQVIYNANPEAVSAATGRPRSAEVHALGNPQGKEILALEIRRPGPTFRAWDHARFPLRPIDVDKTLDALNLRATRPADFIVPPRPLAGCPGVFRSVQSEWFVVDHLRPRPEAEVGLPAGTPMHMLHAVRGSVELRTANDRTLASLTRGQSALIPVTIGSYRLATADGDAEVVMVTIPPSTAVRTRGGRAS